jgi:hypothetical protein
MIATVWLILVVVLAVFAWMSSRRLAVLSLPAVAALAAWAVYVPLGQPTPFRPAHGNYLILGADIKKNVYIKVLLKGADGVVTFYTLPYTDRGASDVQNAQDDAHAEGGQPQATFGGDGDMTIGVNRPPEVVKPAEAPAAAPF